MEENIKIHRSETVGRYVRAKRYLPRNSLISSCQSFQTAVADDSDSCCHWCGRTVENEQQRQQYETCQQCKTAIFCPNCSSSGQHRHLESGECVLSSTYASLNDHSLPTRGLLAYRLLTNLSAEGELIHSLDDLVGSRDDCDEGRLAIARSVKIAYRTCFPGKEFQEMRFLDILGKIRRNGFKFGTGITLFSTSSLFNHSCAPNAVLTIEYSQANPSRLLACVRAIRDIEMNEEINISYHPLGLVPAHIRREVLMEKHEFECQCPSCKYSDQCDALLLGVEPSEEEEEEVKKERGDDQGDLNPALLQLETLTEILNEMETEMNQAVAEAKGDPARVSSILDPIVENHSSIFKYLANLQRLNPSHYLLFQYDVVLSEIALVCHHFDALGHHTSQWLGRLESNLPQLSNLCDVHLYCRMSVLQAESCYDRFLSPNRLYHTEGFKERTLGALARALSIATSIYSDSYQLVTLLQEKVATVQSQLSHAVASAVTFREISFDSGSDLRQHLPEHPLMIRLVGFSQGIDYTSDQTLQAANKLLQHLSDFLDENLCPNSVQPTPCLVWDGDVYSQDSFTFLIPELTSRLPPHWQLFCFLQSPQDLTSFQSHWSRSPPPPPLRLEITLLIYSADQGWNSSNYDHYAVQNHRQLSPRIVFCFGGGQTVLFEYEACHSCQPGDGDGHRDVFYFYDVHRRNRVSGDMEQSALLPYLPPKG
jgi:hypothetical protein